MSFVQPGIRLTIPKKDEPSARENLEAIERWANTHVTNKIVAGTGVTIDTQALGTGSGAEGTGIVTINASGGGGGPPDNLMTAYADNSTVASDYASSIAMQWDTSTLVTVGTALTLQSDNASVQINEDGIYVVEMVVGLGLVASASIIQTGSAEVSLNPSATGANSDFNQGFLFVADAYYVAAAGTTINPTYLNFSWTLYMDVGDVFSFKAGSASNHNGTVTANNNTSFFIRMLADVNYG